MKLDDLLNMFDDSDVSTFDITASPYFCVRKQLGTPAMFVPILKRNMVYLPLVLKKCIKPVRSLARFLRKTPFTGCTKFVFYRSLVSRQDSRRTLRTPGEKLHRSCWKMKNGLSKREAAPPFIVAVQRHSLSDTSACTKIRECGCHPSDET